MNEKRPRRRANTPFWNAQLTPPGCRTENTIGVSVWQSGAVRVISELCNAELPGGGVGPTWHMSVTRLGKRPRPRDVEKALEAFDMLDAEEDNHHPGNARHFFLPVDPAARGICECKTTEDTIVDPDGYTWTNPKPSDPEGCRGCELVRLIGKGACPIHRESRAP